MASYTDAINQFNPYVQQLPIELMMKVGMQKQAQYDQGVQKIQQSIDNVAGLDIYSNVDKQHLQSKMNELGNRLRTVAAGDFSNQQLVNSTAGMTGSIIKDPTIRAAVQSTAHIKSQFEKIKELEKKGLTDKHNDDFFADRLNAYANRKDLTDAKGNPITFGEDYYAHVDFSKALKEELIGAGLDERTIEEILETDPVTKQPKLYNVPIMDKDGKKQLVDKAGKPLFEKKVKYADIKVVEKIATNRAAVEAGMRNVFRRGDVKKQLEIDGWANYRNTDVETLLNPLIEKHQELDSLFDQDRLNIANLASAENISPEEKTLYEERLKKLDSDKAESEKEFANIYEFAKNNPEAFKQNYYETSVKNDLMKEFLKENVAKTFETNPGKEQENWDQRMAFDILKENNNVKYQNASLAISAKNAAISADANKRDWMVFYGDRTFNPVTGTYDKKPDPTKAGKLIKPEDLSLFKGSNPGELPVNYAINMVQDDITTLAKGKTDTAWELYTDMYKKMYPKQDLTKEKLVKNLDGHLALYNKSNPNNKLSREQFLFRTVDGLQNEYAEKGFKFSPNDAAKHRIYGSYSEELVRNTQMVARLSEETWKDIAVANPGAPAPRTSKTILIDGKSVTVSPEDQELYYMAYGEITPAHPLYRENESSFMAGMPFIGSVSRKRQEANAILEAKYGKGYHKKFGNQIDMSPFLKGNADFNKLFNERLQKVVGVSDITGGSLPWNDTEARETSKANIATYIAAADQRSLGGATKEQVLGALDGVTAISWVGKKPTTFREDWTGKIVITTKADNTGEAKQFVISDISKQDLETLADLELGAYEKKPIQIAIRSNRKTNSTNSGYQVSSPDAWKGAFLKENRIDPSITKAGWTYRADAVDAAEGSGYRMVHYIKPPNGKFTTIFGQTIINSDRGVEETFGKTNIQILQATLNSYLQNQKK
jgi:hypothetical protein